MNFENATVSGGHSSDLDGSIEPLHNWIPLTSTPKRDSSLRSPRGAPSTNSRKGLPSIFEWNVTALEKESRASQAGFCAKCISDRHVGEQCEARVRCRVCFGNHHNLLCEGSSDIFDSCNYDNTSSRSFSFLSRPTVSVKELRATEAGFCAKCLSDRHTAGSCKSEVRCRVCAENHHHRLCEDESEIFKSYDVEDESSESYSFLSRPTVSVKELRATEAGFCAKCLSDRHTAGSCTWQVKCRVCSENHHDMLCEADSEIFESYDIQDEISESYSFLSRPTVSVKELRATEAGFCAKCLSDRHTAGSCTWQVKCRVCSENHHHMLCEDDSEIFEEIDYDCTRSQSSSRLSHGSSERWIPNSPSESLVQPTSSSSSSSPSFNDSDSHWWATHSEEEASAFE